MSRPNTVDLMDLDLYPSDRASYHCILQASRVVSDSINRVIFSITISENAIRRI